MPGKGSKFPCVTDKKELLDNRDEKATLAAEPHALAYPFLVFLAALMLLANKSPKAARLS